MLVIRNIVTTGFKFRVRNLITNPNKQIIWMIKLIIVFEFNYKVFILYLH